MSSVDGIYEVAFSEAWEEIFGRQTILDSSYAPNLELPAEEPGFFLPYSGMASMGAGGYSPEAQVEQYKVQAPPVLFGQWAVPQESPQLGQDERREDDRRKAKKTVRAVRRQRRPRHVPSPYQACQRKVVSGEVEGLQLTHTNSGGYLNLHCHETL